MAEPIQYFFDMEATGVDYRNDRLIQLAFLKVQGDRMEAFEDLCYTDIEMNDAVVAVHGITNAMLEDKYWPDETDSFQELERGNDPANYFVSHNNRLDLAMLANEGLQIVMQCIDTDKCSRHLLTETHSYKLKDLIDRYGLESRAERVAREIGLKDLDAHDALSDALWHYALYELLLEKVGGEVEKLVEITATPMLLEKVTFGKHRNRSFEELIASEPEALVWMYVNMAADWEDLEFTLEHWLKTKPYFWNKAQKEREENERLLF
jgi:DNA polymerase III epsilon subunit-like protein